jgi:hypothetical protein
MWAATLQQVSGRDTDKAELTAHVTQADAQEYCSRDPGGETVAYGGKETLQECVNNVMKQESSKVYRATADCPGKAINSTNGVYGFVQRTCDDKNYCFNQWKDPTGKILEDDAASGVGVVDQQFQTLCPDTAKNLPVSHPIDLNDAKSLDDKYDSGAMAACDTYSEDYITQVSKYDHKWDDSTKGFLATKFDKFRSVVSSPGVLTLLSEHLMLQNGFGAFERVTIACNYDTQNDKVLGFNIEQ